MRPLSRERTIPAIEADPHPLWRWTLKRQRVIRWMWYFFQLPHVRAALFTQGGKGSFVEPIDAEAIRFFRRALRIRGFTQLVGWVSRRWHESNGMQLKQRDVPARSQGFRTSAVYSEPCLDFAPLLTVNELTK